MKNPTTLPRPLLALGALTLLVALAGCSDSRYEQIKDDPTPNLSTLYQRPTDVDNAVVVTFNENGRMFWQDMGRAFYWDRASRLTRENVPHQ